MARARSVLRKATRDMESYALRPSSDMRTVTVPGHKDKAARTLAATASVPRAGLERGELAHSRIALSKTCAHSWTSALVTKRRETSLVAIAFPSVLRKAVRRAMAKPVES